MTKVWEKLESKSSYHFPNSWWFRGQIVLNTWHLRKLWRAHEDQIKPRTSELFESETLEQFSYYQPLVLHFKLLNWKSKNVIYGKENSEGKYYNTILFWLLVDISLAIHLHNCSIQANRSIIPQNDKKVPAWKKAMDIVKQQEKFSPAYFFKGEILVNIMVFFK